MSVEQKQIQTIDSLIDLLTLLKQNNPNDYPKILSNLQLDKSEFGPFAFFKKGCYTRNCIERTAVFELILICWDAHTKSPIHAHDQQRCWVYQVDGAVSEIRYITGKNGKLEPSNKMELTKGKLTYMQDAMGYHALINSAEAQAMTLHLYASPIDSCKVLNAQSQTFNEKELSYHSVKGLLTNPN